MIRHPYTPLSVAHLLHTSVIRLAPRPRNRQPRGAVHFVLVHTRSGSAMALNVASRFVLLHGCARFNDQRCKVHAETMEVYLALSLWALAARRTELPVMPSATRAARSDPAESQFSSACRKLQGANKSRRCVKHCVRIRPDFGRARQAYRTLRDNSLRPTRPLHPGTHRLRLFGHQGQHWRSARETAIRLALSDS